VFDVLSPGRKVVLDTGLSVAEATSRLVTHLLIIGLFALLFATLGTREARTATGMLERLLEAREESCVSSSLPES
jgi:hypothetical protein